MSTNISRGGVGGQGLKRVFFMCSFVPMCFTKWNSANSPDGSNSPTYFLKFQISSRFLIKKLVPLCTFFMAPSSVDFFI